MATLGYRRFMKFPGRALAVFGLASALTASAALAASSPNVVRDGISFGDAEYLSGVYITNFENSTFVLCDRKKGECGDWAGSPESYGLRCEPAACADLEARIKVLNGSHDKWGLFAIDIFGGDRLALTRAGGWATRRKRCWSSGLQA